MSLLCPTKREEATVATDRSSTVVLHNTDAPANKSKPSTPRDALPLQRNDERLLTEDYSGLMEEWRNPLGRFIPNHDGHSVFFKSPTHSCRAQTIHGRNLYKPKPITSSLSTKAAIEIGSTITQNNGSER